MSALAARVNVAQIFPETPSLSLVPRTRICGCGGRMKVKKTRRREVVTMEVGPLSVQETVVECLRCNAERGSEELAELVPPWSRYSYGVMVYVGRALFQQGKSELAVKEELKKHNIDIARSEIGYLGKRFVAYLSIAHRESAEALKTHLAHQGGYILHLDGTCEGDSPFLMTGLDGISGIVLHNVKIASEKAESITPLLQEVLASLGAPIGVVSDMSKGIDAAVREVFPKVPHFLCHFHFLRDIGKDLLEGDYDALRRSLRGYALKKKLRDLAKKCKAHIDTDPKMKLALSHYVDEHIMGRPVETLPAVVLAYVLALWILNAKLSSSGQGFPFDRPHLSLYERVAEVDELFAKKATLDQKHSLLANLRKVIHAVVQDQVLQQVVERLREKAEVFDRLRAAMSIALPDSKSALNDDGNSTSAETIKEALTDFRADQKLISRAESQLAYKKILKQLDTYWNKLFADPINVQTLDGTQIIQPQRTNNSLERLFRRFKRTLRRKSGCHSLTKTLQGILADTLLINNLDNSDYLALLLRGKSSMQQRFAEINPKQVRKYLAELAADDSPLRLPHGMKKLLRLSNLPKKLAVKPFFRLAA